jgi:chromosome segregation ATPase
MQHSETVNLRMELRSLQREMTSLRDTIATSDRRLLETVNSIRGEVDSTRQLTAKELQAARSASRKQADAIATRLQKRHEEQGQQLARQIDEIKSSAEETSASFTTRLTDISADVGAVRTEMASTRTDVDKTASELRRVTGDMGVMSGLIATNAKELAALRAMGDRNYFEFRFGKSKSPQRVGDIQVLLKRTDTRRNRFTLEIIADDKRVEKKDRTLNEPIQFYVLSKARQPYELVVNELAKDLIVGYLATPKTQLARQ